MVDLISNETIPMDFSSINPSLAIEALPENVRYQFHVVDRNEIQDISQNVFNLQVGSGQFLGFYILYLDLILLVFFLITSIMLLVLLYNRVNQHYQGLLLVQGFGKRDLHLAIVARMIFIVLFSFIIGISVGFLTGYAWTSSLLISNTSFGNKQIYNLKIPIEFHWIEFSVILLMVFSGILIMSIIFQLINRKKEYAAYLLQKE
jgi:ABC-type antimicrobial peptide transport system permease subunit